MVVVVVVDVQVTHMCCANSRCVARHQRKTESYKSKTAQNVCVFFFLSPRRVRACVRARIVCTARFFVVSSQLGMDLVIVHFILPVVMEHLKIRGPVRRAACWVLSAACGATGTRSLLLHPALVAGERGERGQRGRTAREQADRKSDRNPAVVVVAVGAFVPVFLHAACFGSVVVVMLKCISIDIV